MRTNIQISLILVVLFLTGCTNSFETGDVKTENNNASDYPATQLPEKEKVGSRKSPAPLGKNIIFSSSELEASMKISELYRGQEAIDYAISLNNYNKNSLKENLPGSKELIIFKVDFELLKYDNIDDEYYWLSDVRFDYYSSSYSQIIDDYIYVADLPDLAFKLYEGGTASGLIAIVVDKTDKTPTLAYEDSIWFELYK